jgi:hypothetical protein
MSQTRHFEAEERDLRAKAGANLRAGNREAAAQYALRLQTVQAELAENRKQLEQAETTYENLVKARNVSVQAAKAKLETLKSAITDMKMKKALAELTEMSTAMIGNIGGAGAGPADRDGRRGRDKAAGRAASRGRRSARPSSSRSQAEGARRVSSQTARPEASRSARPPVRQPPSQSMGRSPKR